MALINCPECGTQMSEKASACPKCGEPNPNAPQQFMQAGFAFNPCAWHANAPAVASCVTCGKAMCKQCVDEAVFNVDNKPQCNECSLQMLSENIAVNKKAKTWSIVKLVFLLIFIFIGLTIFMSTGDIANAWIYAGIGGLPSALKTFMRRSAEERLADEAMSRVDPGEGCFQQMIGIIVKIIFAFLCAPIAAVWFTIKHIITITKTSKAIKDDQEDYDTIMSKMQVA